MIYTASSAADQTACWITGIVIAALIFLFVKFAAKGSKPLEKIMLASGCVIVLLTTLIVKVPAPGSFNPKPDFGERKKKRQTDTHTNILVHRADSPVVHTDTEH